ncbi:MAG: alanine racemase C-terminal domain-containing protein [Planctomycetota bacterium]
MGSRGQLRGHLQRARTPLQHRAAGAFGLWRRFREPPGRRGSAPGDELAQPSGVHQGPPRRRARRLRIHLARPRATRIATLPIGYADGLPWRASPGGEVLLRGQRAPIVGRISMDYTTVDVGHIPDVHVGDVATLIGRDGSIASCSATSRSRRAPSRMRFPAAWAGACCDATWRRGDRRAAPGSQRPVLPVAPQPQDQART